MARSEQESPEILSESVPGLDIGSRNVDLHRSSHPEITIVILTFDQKDSTLACLASLKRVKEPPFEILVWDNGSSDGTAGAVEASFPSAHLHAHARNLGVASGRNRAADLAIDRYSPDFLLFLDNDMLVEPDFVRALHKPFSSFPKVGQTQAKLRFMDNPARLNDGGGCRIEFWRGRTVPVGFNELDQGQYDTLRSCIACGGAMMVRTEVFRELEGFDEAFGPFGPEDLDFSLRLQDAGYRALFVPDAVAYHAVSHTIGADFEKEYAFDKSRHWFLLMRRHAPFTQRLLFWLIGAPYLVLRTGIREIRRGNIGALLALIQGALHRSTLRD